MIENNRYIEEDEIDLRELFAVIWKNKWKIFLFTFVITTLAVGYVLIKPNIYKSEIILIPQEQKSPSMGGLGALAGLAGVDVGGGGVSALSNMNLILKDFNFQIKIIRKFNLIKELENTKNYIYPFGLKFESQNENNQTLAEREFLAYKKLSKIIAISEDKKSGVITLSAELENRFLAKKLVDIYLKEITTHLRILDMKDIDSKLSFYETAVSETENIELQSQLTQLMSSLIQKKVLANASEFYIVKKMIDSRVPQIVEKTKPKRSLIVIVAFVTSIILGIFLVFFIEFLKGDEENEKK